MTTVYVSGKCGHAARGFSGETYICDRRAGHKGFHGQTTKLRDGKVTTNWDDNGKRPNYNQ